MFTDGYGKTSFFCVCDNSFFKVRKFNSLFFKRIMQFIFNNLHKGKVKNVFGVYIVFACVIKAAWFMLHTRITLHNRMDYVRIFYVRAGFVIIGVARINRNGRNVKNLRYVQSSCIGCDY